MITQRTQRLLVVLLLIVRWLFALWIIPYFLIAWFFDRRPEGWRTSLHLHWYLLIGMWSVFLLSITLGHMIRTVLALTGLALLAVAPSASFDYRWLWLAGCLLITGVLFVEALPRLRKIFASFREKYRKISKASEI